MQYTGKQQGKQVFENFLFKCVTRPDLSGVRLIRLHGNNKHVSKRQVFWS